MYEYCGLAYSVRSTEIRLVLPGELELETSSCFENRFRLVRLDIGSGLDQSTH